MKQFKIIIAVIISTVLVGCPDDEDCNDLGRIANVPNLVKLTPLQQQYQQGDILIMKIEVPAQNTYFGDNLNLLELTGDLNAQLISSAGNLLQGNEIEIIKGFEDGNFNWFGVPFNSLTGNYELELKITLNRAGNYYWQTEDKFILDGSTCNRYFIDTNIEWTVFGEVAFEVVP